ncbi:MAG: hypothetical protein PT944_06815 [Actinomycetaceae bacterium]|nr:hypothetical protein [Arcanobacterium sp.]MDD7687603.1 hypothetical protein [Actinomycetaceae bacterium]MDY5273159.1 hypothetical protein [Arcanobacterium sp.]
MSVSKILQPDVQLLSAVFRGSDDGVFHELSHLAQLVGVDLTRLSHADMRDGVLRFTSDNCPSGYVNASFHDLFAPYFSAQAAMLDVRQDSATILELLVAVGATIRGKVVGVVGAHGGAGASTLAATLARELVRDGGGVALIDVDPASAGIELLLSLVGVPGKRWADVHGQGALLAGKLNSSLPLWHGVRVLSADERGGMPPQAEAGPNMIAAISQMNAWTVIDVPTSALVPGMPTNSILEWCDYLFIVTRSDTVHLAATHTLLSRLGSNVLASVVAVDVKSKNEAAHIAQMLAVEFVHTVRFEHSYDAALEHGVEPGERSRSRFSRDVNALCAYLEQVVP